MIGKITKGGSFGGCIAYVLEDKKRLGAAEKREMQAMGLDPNNRAEVILFNKCFGDKAELIRDFNEVRCLNGRVEKPVLHISLRLAEGEQLDKAQLMETAETCAKQLGFADNQYIAVLHRDTKGQHIHIVANRIGFDGKLVSDAHDFRKIAALCRSVESKYNLRQVLSPRKFLSEKQRFLPRHDSRKVKLANDIRNVLQRANDYTSFENSMKKLGYQIIKGRGICFIDNKKVRIKGSEAGFPLAKIEKILAFKAQWRDINSRREKQSFDLTPPSLESNISHTQRQESSGGMEFSNAVSHTAGDIVNLILDLLRPQPFVESSGHTTESEWKKEQKKRKRKLQQRR